jgi:hypothetical protein
VHDLVGLCNDREHQRGVEVVMCRHAWTLRGDQWPASPHL